MWSREHQAGNGTYRLNGIMADRIVSAGICGRDRSGSSTLAVRVRVYGRYAKHPLQRAREHGMAACMRPSDVRNAAN